MIEEWRNIDGFPYYMISSLCRIKSLSKSVKCRNGVRIHKEKILKQAITQFGYKQVLLYEDGSRKNKLVHVLFAKAFIPLVDGKPFVNHKNGIKSDNRIENLEWVTHKENMDHAFKTGLRKMPSGKDHYNIKKIRNNITNMVFTGLKEASLNEGISVNALKLRLNRNNKIYSYV